MTVLNAWILSGVALQDDICRNSRFFSLFLLYIKLHFGCCTCSSVSGEEGFRGGACETGDEVCRELANSSVVCLHGFVVALAFDGDAIFGTFELHVEFLEALVALEIRVVFGDGHEALEGSAEGALHFLEALEGCFVVHEAFVELDGSAHAAAHIHDFGEGALFEVGFALHGTDEIRDEVKTALVGVFDLCPLCFYAFFEGDDVVVCADAFPDDDEQDDDDNDDGD